MAGWVGPGWPGPILLSGNYPGTIRDLGWPGWAGLGVLAGWAWTERQGLLGWLGVLAGCWLDFDEKGTKNGTSQKHIIDFTHKTIVFK